MRDNLHKFGAIDLTGSAGDKYAADKLNLGTIDGRYTKGAYHGPAEGLAVEFVITTVVDAGTTIAFLEDSADDSTFVKIATSGAGVATPAKGTVFTVMVPKKRRQYSRAGMTTSTTVSTGAANAAEVFGPNL